MFTEKGHTKWINIVSVVVRILSSMRKTESEKREWRAGWEGEYCNSNLKQDEQGKITH